MADTPVAPKVRNEEYRVILQLETSLLLAGLGMGLAIYLALV
jgi:hypothetical protein